MKSIVISIRPKWVAKILNGEKTIEIRKSKPKEQVEWVYIYCTKDKDLDYGFNGKVVARFKISYIDKIQTALAFNENIDEIEINSNLTLTDIMRYAEGKNVYGWHIQKLQIFNKSKELSEFGLKKAPQSWCYVKEQ